ILNDLSVTLDKNWRILDRYNYRNRKGEREMTALPVRRSHAVRVLVLLGLAASAAMAQTATARIVSAAKNFMSTLDEKQRQRFQFAFDDREQRVKWSNLPVRMVPRAGLSIGELSAPQRSAAMELVSAALSRRGLEKVQQIMDGDEVLKGNER